MEEIKKICSKCGEEKSLDLFDKSSDGVYKRRADCKRCRAAYKKQHNVKHADRIKIQRRQYRSLNKEKIAAYDAKNYLENKERDIARTKKWTENNREHVNAYAKKRRDEDLALKFQARMTSRISNMFKGRIKTCSAIKDLGCNFDFFIEHITAQFKPGMTRENYGNKRDNWSLDHIVPLNYFKKHMPDDFKIGCHYLNYQPLWMTDNVAKSDKLPDNYLEIIENIKKVIEEQKEKGEQ